MLVNKEAKLSETVNIYICLRLYMKLKEHETKAKPSMAAHYALKLTKNVWAKALVLSWAQDKHQNFLNTNIRTVHM